MLSRGRRPAPGRLSRTFFLCSRSCSAIPGRRAKLRRAHSFSFRRGSCLSRQVSVLGLRVRVSLSFIAFRETCWFELWNICRYVQRSCPWSSYVEFSWKLWNWLVELIWWVRYPSFGFDMEIAEGWMAVNSDFGNNWWICFIACSLLHWLDHLILWSPRPVAYANVCYLVYFNRHPWTNHLKFLSLMRWECRVKLRASVFFL